MLTTFGTVLVTLQVVLPATPVIYETLVQPAAEAVYEEVGKLWRVRVWGRKTSEECEEQFEADNAICRTLPTKQARAKCFEQAMFRYSQCLAGRWEPPLIWPE